MKLSRFMTGLLSVALLAFMVSDTLGQDQGRRGDRGGRGGPGGFQRGGPGGGFQRGGPPGGFRGGGDALGLLRRDEVKAELQISPDQEEALTKLEEKVRSERPERPEGVDFRNMSEEERGKFFESMRKQAEERTAKVKEQLEEVLLPEQMERLEQIALQVEGVRALAREDVAAKLKMTDEQKKKLGEVRNELQAGMRERMRELMESGGGPDAFAKVRKEMEDEVLGVLTSDQRKQFEEMKGEPFDLPNPFGFGRGGPGGGRGFGGPGGRGPGGRGRGGDDGGRRGRPPVEE